MNVTKVETFKLFFSLLRDSFPLILPHIFSPFPVFLSLPLPHLQHVTLQPCCFSVAVVVYVGVCVCVSPCTRLTASQSSIKRELRCRFPSDVLAAVYCGSKREGASLCISLSLSFISLHLSIQHTKVLFEILIMVCAALQSAFVFYLVTCLQCVHTHTHSGCVAFPAFLPKTKQHLQP